MGTINMSPGDVLNMEYNRGRAETRQCPHTHSVMSVTLATISHHKLVVIPDLLRL